MVYKNTPVLGNAFPDIPRVCFLCGVYNSQVTASLCSGCLQDLPLACGPKLPVMARPGRRPTFDLSVSALAYQYPADILIQALKYHRRIELANDLGSMLARVVLKVSTNLPTCLVPVPLHPARYRQRGYNQATLIARAVARTLGIPVQTRLVRRTRNTQAQFDLPPGQRQRNVRGAFSVTSLPAVETVAIIDDVMTTGATMEAMAICLRAAGAVRVEAWSCARAP